MTTPSSITQLRPLARGGMAELHLGKMRGIAGVEKLVVVKRILPTLAHRHDFVEQFISEARVSATLQHPNIVQTYDVGEDDDGYYIMMEYLEGADLRKVLSQLQKDRRGFPREFAIQVLIGILAGLHYAHQRTAPDGTPLEIVHCDVSPHNTFITWDGAVKLLDFGVAKASTNLGEEDDDLVQGKLRYMSPEQCLNAPLDPRSDVYAAGIILYELLTGRRAHRGSDRTALQRAILDQAVASPSVHGVELDQELESIVMRALQKKRSARFQSARSFQRALEDYSQSRGIFPSPIRLGEWIRELVPTPQENTANRTGSLTKKELGLGDLKSTEHAEMRRVHGVIVVHMRGRLNEAFDGRTIGEQLDGPVILDLQGVERITSFGIRSWLEMMRVSRARPLYLARVPGTFVNQVSMVRGLLGKGRVCSFSVPFLCPEDHTDIQHLVSGEEGRVLIEEQVEPDATCPRSPSHRPVFDEDPDFYQVLADSFETDPPAAVVALFDQLDDDRDLPPIEKVLDAEATTFHIRRSLDATLRWRRLLDGLEGRVVFDFSDVTTTSPDGLPPLVKGLELVARDLRRIEVVAAPRAVWGALVGSEKVRPLLDLRSLVIQVTCPAEACAEHGLIRQIVAMAPEDPSIPFQIEPCRSCLGPLTVQGGALSELPGFTPPMAPPRPAEPPAARKVAKPGRRRGCLGALFGIFGG